jgi:hypothetical protein
MYELTLNQIKTSYLWMIKLLLPIMVNLKTRT